MTARVETALAPTSSIASSLAVVGLVALGLTSLGLFAAVAQAVGRRTYEIGVRRALGAPDSSIAGLVSTETLVLVAAGLAVGVGLALIGSRAMTALLYNVDPLDPAALAVAPTILLAVCLAAVWLPTRRALRVDAATALRHD
jgi:ABC-type antimicrobial peptide transport system permease subunit